MKVAVVVPLAAGVPGADRVLDGLPELARQWELEVWSPATADLRSVPVDVHTFEAAGPGLVRELQSHDLVVHVLGSDPAYLEVLALADVLPGLLVLQDDDLAELVVARALRRGRLRELVEHVRLVHGTEHADVLRRHRETRGTDAWARTLAEVPLLESVSRSALGAVACSAAQADRLDGLLLGQVSVAPTEAEGVTAWADALVTAADAALARRPHVHLAQDLARHLTRLDLHGEPVVLNRVADLSFELFDLS